MLLSTQYVLYGEWLYTRHTIFSTPICRTTLPSSTFTTDKADVFLSTERLTDILRTALFIVSMHVLHTGTLPTLIATCVLKITGHFSHFLEKVVLLCYTVNIHKSSFHILALLLYQMTAQYTATVFQTK